jgi:Trypsin-like peptidase domain
LKTDDALHGISTLLTANTPFGQGQGTGFFYEELGAGDTDSPQWRIVDRVWLVTNRHVVLPRFGSQEHLPDSFIFHLRRLAADGQVEWDPVVLDQPELLSRLKLHPDPTVDVAIVEVFDLITDRINSRGDYLQWYGVSEESFAGKNNISVEVSDDVAVVGYPRGYYDEYNMFPIVKSGIVASRWGSFFNGQPYFLIDAKLFPGSSGSIVITKPRDLVVAGGQVMYAKEKQFAFLGVYSGEPIQQSSPIELDDVTITRKQGFNLGIVWYGDLVKAATTGGIRYGEVTPSAPSS